MVFIDLVTFLISIILSHLISCETLLTSAYLSIPSIYHKLKIYHMTWFLDLILILDIIKVMNKIETSRTNAKLSDLCIPNGHQFQQLLSRSIM